ncbi:MAG: hypothetical protein AB9866_22470 [Syntrophobacteraceae bacterium]
MGKTKIEIGNDGYLTAPVDWLKAGKPRPYLAFTNNMDIPVKFPKGRYELTVNNKGLIVAAGMDPRIAVVYGPSPLSPNDEADDLKCYDTPFGRI